MSEAAVADLLDVAHEIGRKRLTWGASGNISLRLDGREFLISASGAALESLGDDKLVLCLLDGGEHVRPARASLETPIHRAIYGARGDTGCVVHASPFYATLVSSSNLQVGPSLTVDSAYYVGRLRRIPFAPPGSNRFARIAAEAAEDSDVVLVDNHGALTLGATPSQALQRLECLEILCRMVTYGALGVPLRPLEETQVRDFLASMESGDTA